MSYWSQPPDEYEPVPGTIFVESKNIPLRSLVGFKIHISVDPIDVRRCAELVLPTLRLTYLHHKVVGDDERYRRMNKTDQRGKFITVYPGPAVFAQRVLDWIDPLL